MTLDLSRARWRKSSYSGNSGNCVEMAELTKVVVIRDSKNPNAPVLIVTRNEWQKLVDHLKDSSTVIWRLLK